jgi:hypothetical protein
MMDTKMIDLKKLEKWPVEIQKAAKGDKQAAKEVLDAIKKYLKNGEPLPEKLNEYLIAAITEVAEGVNPSKAFNLTGKQGNRKSHSKDEREMIARHVYDLSKSYGLHKSEGRTSDKNGAYYQASLDFGISPETAQRCFEEFGSGQGYQLDEELRQEAEEKK